MQEPITRAVKDIVKQLEDKQHWQHPVYMLILAPNGMFFSRFNLDGTIENLVVEDAEYIEYPVIIRLIDSQGETIKGVVTKDGFEFSEN